MLDALARTSSADERDRRPGRQRDRALGSVGPRNSMPAVLRDSTRYSPSIRPSGLRGTSLTEAEARARVQRCRGASGHRRALRLQAHAASGSPRRGEYGHRGREPDVAIAGSQRRQSCGGRSRRPAGAVPPRGGGSGRPRRLRSRATGVRASASWSRLTLLGPLRDHAIAIAGIAQAAYTQAGTDLLRLLGCAARALDADAAWVQGMVDTARASSICRRRKG